MKCVFLCSVPISHIIPIQPIIEFLCSKEIDVTVFSSKGNKNKIESYGAKFVEYPFSFVGESSLEPLMERGKIFNKYIKNECYEQAYDYFMEKDIEYFYDHSFDNLKLLFNLIKKEEANFIIRDAVDRYGNVIAKMLNIPSIGLITHSLYSKKFFNSNPTCLYKTFMDALHIDSLDLDQYFMTFREKCEEIHDKVFLRSNTFKINTFHQFDPCEELTLINSIDSFQPNDSYEENREYILVYPDLKRFNIENEINISLKNFVARAKKYNKKIVYIATGSMLSLKYEFCLKLIDNLLKNNLCVIISNNMDYAKLRNHYCTDKYDVYVDKFLPQQYILSNSDLFISSAGQNSILEAIYHMVPILAMPITSEQKLNGLIIDEKGIGLTTYRQRSKYKTYGKLVNELHYDKKFKENIKILNSDLINGKSDYNLILDYVRKRSEKIKDFYITR